MSPPLKSGRSLSPGRRVEEVDLPVVRAEDHPGLPVALEDGGLPGPSGAGPGGGLAQVGGGAGHGPELPQDAGILRYRSLAIVRAGGVAAEHAQALELGLDRAVEAPRDAFVAGLAGVGHGHRGVGADGRGAAGQTGRSGDAGLAPGRRRRRAGGRGGAGVRLGGRGAVRGARSLRSACVFGGARARCRLVGGVRARRSVVATALQDEEHNCDDDHG